MKITSNSKTTIIVIVVCVLLVILYFYFEGGKAPSGSGGLVTNSSSGSVGTAELSLLNQIQSLKIDTAIFTDPVYQSLQDYSVQIPPQNVGRPNPFAPIPGVANTATLPDTRR